ncbi:MAG TPA: PQQ-binding-like beta-propeller repeat protein [Chloroflexota bacterium]|nr:PQQ-binding-like beta-propeller repeat protein [Chloroflexota bacterium]
MLAVSLLLAGAGWPTYQHDPGRSGSTTDPALSPASAGRLTLAWTFQTGGAIAAQPVIVGNIVYIGSWDGYEYALDATSGALRWKADLGRSLGTTGFCAPMGVSATPTVTGGILYVGGGKPFFYALRVSDGHVLWKIRTGDERQNGRYYNWASPLIYRGSAYLGVASRCDEPLVPGALLQADLGGKHRVLHTFAVVPKGQLGGAIWTTPALDRKAGTIFVSTGNEGRLPASSQRYARAVIALSTTLRVRSVWQLPDSQVSTPDSDWSGTPTLFTGSGGTAMLATVNKNGYVYVFDRRHLVRGPTWRSQIANPDLNVSSTSFGGGLLYAAGSKGSRQGHVYAGSVRALDPATGAVVWLATTSAPVWPALTYANGLVIDGAGSVLQVRDARTGGLLFHYRTGGRLYGPASAGDGRLFTGSSDGRIYAFTPPPASTARGNTRSEGQAI